MASEFEAIVRDTETGETKRGGDITKRIPLLEMGRTADSGIVYFEHTKTAWVRFSAEFIRPPRVSLVPTDSSNVPAFRAAVSATRMIIRFKQKFTGAVEWIALERRGG